MTSNTTERDTEVKWERSAKGRGNRWRMLRDIVALLAVAPMTLMEIQDSMLSLKGLSRSKVSDMIDELSRPFYIKVTSWSLDGGVQMGYMATKKGVYFWIKNEDAIPASIALVAQTISYVKGSGATTNEV